MILNLLLTTIMLVSADDYSCTTDLDCFCKQGYSEDVVTAQECEDYDSSDNDAMEQEKT
jgi:hypothetical protein